MCAACFQELPWQQSTNLTITPLANLNITCALFHYQPPISYFVSQLKFHNQLIYAKLFSQCFITHLQKNKNPLPDCLLPVPLHHQRLRERGFNQAVEIARPIAQHFKIPLIHNFCRRIKSTKPQTHLSAKEREQNMKNAFVIHKPLKIKHIAILDDVVTTGNTVYALSQLLKNHGVEKVEVWCVAKTHV